jgi:hypothetical protein
LISGAVSRAGARTRGQRGSVGHEAHPLAHRKGLHIKDLSDELFIVPSLHPGTGFYAHSEAVWRDAG